MNVARLNGSARAARINAERNLAEMEAIYSRLIVQAAREASSAFTASTQVTTVTASNWLVPPDGLLLNLEALASKATTQLAKLHARIVKQSAAPVLARAGIAWDVTHPLVQTLLDQAGARTGDRLGNTVRPVLQKIVEGAFNDGLPVRDTAALIRSAIGEAAPGQAQMLARTDLNSLNNGGSIMAAGMVGATYKQWLTAEDDRVRDTHAEADGQTVPIDQPFDVGSEALDYPGDPSGSDEEVCNCRCTVIYVDASEAIAASGVSFPAMDRVPARGFATVLPLPEMRPRMPGRDFAAAPTLTAAAAIGWVSDIAFEGAATDDGRYMLPGSLTWREPPLTLMAMTETSDEGHNGAFVAGRMDTFERADTYIDGAALNSGMTAIRAAGVFDIGGVNGAEVARLVGDETVRGVSVDLAVDDWCFRDPETGELLEPEGLSPMDQERAMFGELQYAVRAGTILAATVCPTPAFAEARIALTASGDGRRVIRVWGTIAAGGETLTASAAGLAPALPPRDWFLTPEAKDPTPLTVTKDGRVFGHMALWDSCHTGYPGQCVSPPRSPSGYAYFNLGEVECADGSRVACGAITLESLHADRRLGADATLAHYENTAVVGAFVRAVDGRHGIWVSGALRADLSERHARDLMGAKPSGDWRQTRPGGPLEMLGVHAVNEPGFPVPRLVASALLPSGARASLAFGEPERELDELLTAAGV